MTLAQTIRSWRGTDVQQPNWDSYGAKPISDATLVVASLVAYKLGSTLDCVPLHAVPTKDGGVLITTADETIDITIKVHDGYNLLERMAAMVPAEEE